MAIATGLAAVFVIDRATGRLPYQHLYYVPIVVAGLRFGRRGAWASSLAAVLLYHLANPTLLSLKHEAPDLVQIVLFIAIGLVTAKIRDDAHRLEALAGTDDLTGLHNLRAFEQQLHTAVRRAHGAGSPLSVLVLDIDGLKALNDRHGHLTGAEAVRAVGEIIASEAPPEAFACRYGGDEFVVALPGAALPVAGQTAASILQAVRRRAPTLAGRAFPAGTLSVSIGMACLHAASTDTAEAARIDSAGEALFQAADAALYEAKRSGRGRVCAASGASGALLEGFSVGESA